MESYTNRSDSGGGEECLLEGRYLVTLALINVFTFVVGQPVTAKLLWISFTANKAADILNCNLALFHSFLYLVYLLNLVFLFLYRRHQSALLSVVLSYSQVGGPMSLCFICMERYVAVLHPTAYPLLRSHRWREACAALVWLCSLSVAMTTTLVSDDTSSLSGAVIKSVPFAAMLILTHLMVWATARIARALRTSSPGRDRLHPVKRKAFRTVCATTAINLLCYIPVAAMQKFQIQDQQLFSCVLTPISILLLSAASVVHPLFYLSTKGGRSSASRGRTSGG